MWTIFLHVKGCMTSCIAAAFWSSGQPKINYYMSQGRSTPCIGDGHPTLNRESLFHGYINPYGLGLMSLSPIKWK